MRDEQKYMHRLSAVDKSEEIPLLHLIDHLKAKAFLYVADMSEEIHCYPRRCIPSEAEFTLLLQDKAFVDYFNVFLNQPVFGQRVIYRHKSEDFILDPPVQKRRYKVFEVEVKDWLRTHRFPPFTQSDLFVEYNLCCRLRDTKDGFLQEVNGDIESNNEFWEKTTDFLLGQVLGMQLFRYSLYGTMGDTLFACWVDLERFRRLPVSDPQRLKLYQNIKQTYLVNGAPRELTQIAKHQAFKGALSFQLLDEELSTNGPEFFQHLLKPSIFGSEEVTAFNEDTFLKLQTVALVMLKSYWLPRYILHTLKTAPKSLIRKHLTVGKCPEFFSRKTKHRVQSMFSSSLGAASPTTTPSPVDLITDLVDDYSSDEDTDIEPSELFLLWGGQRFHEANLFPTYEDLTSGRLSDVSSKSRDGSLWTPPVTDSTALSPGLVTEDRSTQKQWSDTTLSDTYKPATKARGYRKHLSKHFPDKVTRSLENVTAEPELSSAARHYIRGSMYLTNSALEKENPRLVGAIVSDTFAGKPLETHLKKTGAFGSQLYLMMWNDLQEYMLIEPNATDAVGRNCRQLQGFTILRRYFLKPTRKTKPTIFLAGLQDDLYNCLLYGTPTEVIIQTQEFCGKALKAAWQEFMITDRHTFVHKVIKHGLRKLSANRRGASLETKEVMPCLDVDTKAFWKALDLALLSKIPLGLKPSEDLNDMAAMASQGFGSLSMSPQKAIYNARLREIVIPWKMDINDIKVTREFLYQRPEIPSDKFTDNKGYQIKKNGVIIDRPPKPRCFPEILSNPIHFEFFKRFLVLKKASMPLMFWKQVQELKETKSPRQRVSKVIQIFRRYFSKSANYGAQLDCNDDIIKQITLMERVTASMIVGAQGAVMRSLERKWFKAYLETYPADDTRPPLPTPSPDTDGMFDLDANWVPNVVPRKLHTYSLWIKFLRTITPFTRFFTGHVQIMVLWVYLRMQAKKALEKKSSNMAEVKIVLHNRLVVVNKLPQDLLFWVEVKKYTELLDDACKPGLLFNPSKVDEENLKLKAHAIVSCFLNSDIQPRLQINVSPEAAANVISLLTVRGPTRSLFHECIMSVFPILFHYYKNCANEWALKKNAANMDKIYVEKLKELRGINFTDSPHSSEIFPSYHHIPLRSFKRIIGPRGDDCVRINFTIASGIRMIIPTDAGRNRTVLDGKRTSMMSLESGSKHSARLKDRSSKDTSGMRGQSKLGSLPRIASVDQNKQATLLSPSKVLVVKESEGETAQTAVVSPVH